MNTPPTNPETPDELDRLFSEFFKGQLKKPWPKAPSPGATAQAEPSELATTRAAETPRNQPAPAARDNTARARFTLAASVALLLGACWALSNGFEPSAGPGPAPGTPRTNMLPQGGADGSDFAPFKKIDEDKAKGNNGGPPKIDMGKLE